MRKLTTQEGFAGFVTIIIVIIIFISLSFIIDTENRIKTYTSKTGCCSIVVNNKAENIYIITYFDNLNNTKIVETEMTPQDADYMINFFQEHCMDHHPIELWENY